MAEQVRSGIRWFTVAQIATQGINALSSLVLYRLLEASDYGIYYMASVALGFFGAISGLGLNTAIIQRRDLTEDELQTAFWASVGAGGLVFVVGALLMPLIARVYHEPRLTWIGVAYAGTFLMSSLTSMSQALLSREMAFGRQAILYLISATVSAVVSVILAYLGFGPWSLACGALLASIPSGLISLRMARFRPRLHFRWAELQKLRRFSLYLTGEIAANYLYNNLDYLTVGYMLGPSAHGYYTQAFNLTHFPYSQMTPIVSRVMFAAFARQQADDEALRAGYLRVTAGLLVLTGPVLAFLAVATEFVVATYLGAKWMPIVSYVRILALVGALKCVVTCVGLIINAKGHSDLGFRWNLFCVAVMAVGMVLGYRYGVIGICWAWVAIFVPLAVGIKKLTHGLIGLSARTYLANMSKPAAFVAIFLVVLLASRAVLVRQFPSLDPKVIGFILLWIALPIYAAGVRALCPEVWHGIFRRRAAAAATAEKAAE